KELWDAVYASPRLLPRLVEGKVLIVRVDDDKLVGDGIKPGIEVLEINGIPVLDYARQKVIPYISASTNQDLEVRAYSYSLFRGPVEESLRLTLADSQGDKIMRSVSRISVNSKPKADSVRHPKWKLYPDGIAYVPIGTFEKKEVVEEFKAAFPEIAKAAVL